MASETEARDPVEIATHGQLTTAAFEETMRAQSKILDALLPARDAAPKADPRMAEFERLLGFHEVAVASTIRAEMLNEDTSLHHAEERKRNDALRAFFAAQLAERPEPLGYVTLVASSWPGNAPMMHGPGTIEECRRVRDAENTRGRPAEVVALTLVSEP